MDEPIDVIVIGGGAAGMMAAGQAALKGARVLVVEKNREPGKKILVTGKGRCNVTNDGELEDFLKNMPGNGRFLYSAFSRFDSRFVQDFFSSQGVPLKVERGQRVFPVSDQAEDIRQALKKFMLTAGAQLYTDSPVQEIQRDENNRWKVCTQRQRYVGSAVIIATGGASYPQTGSSGDGYRWAAALGHSIIPLRPSLVPLESDDPWVASLQGLTLRNVAVKAVMTDGTAVGEDFGELLFTHFGISGPTALTLSRSVVMALQKKNEPVKIMINLKPALSFETLDQRLQREFAMHTRRQFKNAWKSLLPRLLIPVIIQLSGIDPECPVHQISRTERHQLVSLLQNLTLNISRHRPLDEAVVTMGGVSVLEVQPSSMESRLQSGLFFCGEVLDVDGFTGGYNLQTAFSTGAAAGQSAADFALSCQSKRDGI